MKNFTLEILLQILGVGSASGLIYNDNSLLLIGDNSGFLYEYKIDEPNLKKYQLVENPTENSPKKEKKDFEAMTKYNDDVYVFGSGSSKNRNKMVEINVKNNNSNDFDLTNLYSSMQSFSNVTEKQFNLEGVIYSGKEWYLFNRGNKKGNRNVVYTVRGENLTDDFSILSNNYDLPKINGITTGFSDAILIEDKIYFLATAENTNSTTEDGSISGSLIGRIDVKTMKIDFTSKISDKQKFEGLTLYSKKGKNISFLLCEDNDTKTLESTIYKLDLKLKK